MTLLGAKSKIIWWLDWYHTLFYRFFLKKKRCHLRTALHEMIDFKKFYWEAPIFCYCLIRIIRFFM